MQKLNKKRLILKKRLRQREPVLAAWTSLAHPSIIEIFSRIGVDFVGIDIEHSTISQEQSQRIIAAAQAGGSLCLPRVATHNMEMIKRLFDSGADGVIVPMVSNAQEVKEIIAWCKYPPLGKRGFGIARGQGYGFDFDEYTKNWNKVSSLVVQIESIEAVKNINEILAFEEIDGVMVGPYDISGSLGIPGQIEHARVKAAAQVVIKACKKHGKACGTQLIDPDQGNVRQAFLAGYTFVVLASDVFLLWKWSERMQDLVGKFGK
jgi:2-dehydro-3-deoxyglucarate aldolase